ncbi:MAG: hypothetical protein A2855_01265 [Candidatus Liptonbacteria bacterium RIFCSPHIGHO2_01_FULL_57_28]|uniref:Vitamin K epoxide reductase domain-containing protein n=1 Tax=Candidatus Liptonbacteria bacterium RIFCSPHIGHO2_01_FULL_57_28 TaxID=1798647 RepID=A0A1G2CB59_9BACT|nr:MAG: hypothetical protein A2855_01265 [Candidatus Liptonbacteria bacterium RIFCSPHIGHO2_01_FULL_57_28]
MRRLSAIALISVIVFVSVLGAFFMLHTEGEAHAGSDCALGAISRTSCEKIANPLASITFHMKALLQPAIFSAFAAILAFAALALLGLALLTDILASGPPLAAALASAVSINSLAAGKFRAWLTILEKRDPVFLGAMGA